MISVVPAVESDFFHYIFAHNLLEFFFAHLEDFDI